MDLAHYKKMFNDFYAENVSGYNKAVWELIQIEEKLLQLSFQPVADKMI
jgi:hypothetical protein